MPSRGRGLAVRPWAHAAAVGRRRPSHGSSGGSVIETLVLATLFVVVLVSVVVLIGRVLVRRRQERERWEAEGRPEPPERTPEEQERDRRTALTWGCLLVAVPVALVLLYAVTR